MLVRVSVCMCLLSIYIITLAILKRFFLGRGSIKKFILRLFFPMQTNAEKIAKCRVDERERDHKKSA